MRIYDHIMRYIVDKQIEQKRKSFPNSLDYPGSYAYLNDQLIYAPTRKKVSMILKKLPSGKQLEVIHDLCHTFDDDQIQSVIYDPITGAPRLLTQQDGSIHEYNELGDYLQGTIKFVNGRIKTIGGLYKTKEADLLEYKTFKTYLAIREKFKEHLGEDYKHYLKHRVPELKTFTTLQFSIYY